MAFPAPGRLQDILTGSIATLALFLAYVSLPLAGILAGLFVPVPAAFYYLKSGRSTGLVIVAIATAVLVVVADQATAVLYLLGSGIMTLALPFFLERQLGGARAIVSAVGINIAVVAVVATAFGIYRGIDLHALVQKGIETSISQTAALYERSGVTGEDLQLFQEAMRQAGHLIARIYPALAIIGLGCIAGATVSFLARLSSRLPQSLNIGEFCRFRNPDQLVWVVIAAGFSMLLKHEVVTGIALNVLIITLTAYFIQGLAVVAFYFARMATPPLVKWLFYLVLIIQPYLVIAVVVLGLFDLWGNFRSPKKNENL